MNTQYVVVPGDVDDAAVPSGGNVYDRRLCESLPGAHRIAVPGSWPSLDSVAAIELARALDALPDGSVVLFDGLVACGVPEVIVPRAGRLRIAVLVHLPLGAETGLPTDLAAELDARERRTLHGVSAIVATSSWAARRLIEYHGLNPDRVHVVPPGVDLAPLSQGTDGVSQLLCVASLTPRKGHDLLIEALATVKDVPWSCVCVGPLIRDPQHVDKLRHLIAQYGLSDRVHLIGPRTGERLATAYAATDLMVLPSRAETYGMVVTEALARGIPVLATTAGGVPEALGVTSAGDFPGMLVPPGDAAELGVALRRWFEDEELRRRLKNAAWDRRDGLTGWDDTSRRMAAVLDRLRRSPLSRSPH